jgi:hypothetical protein
MRGKDRKRATEVAVNKFEKLGGFWRSGGRMGSASVFADNARFAFRQLVPRREHDAFDRPEKTSRRLLPNVTHAMVPKVHCFNHFNEVGRLGGRLLAGRIKEFKIHEEQVVRLFALVDVFPRAIRVPLSNGEFPIIHAASNLATNGCHPADGEKIDISRWCMKTVSKFDGRGYTFQREAHKAVTAGLGLKDSMIRRSH